MKKYFQLRMCRDCDKQAMVNMEGYCKKCAEPKGKVTMNKREIKRQARQLIKSALRDLRTAEVENRYADVFQDDDTQLKSVFLGTVFYIMPSGKYYLPFACSNVDACGRCKGEGCDYCGHLGSREVYEDELMNEYMDEYANKAGAWIESGEGDPCDLFLVMAVESPEETEDE